MTLANYLLQTERRIDFALGMKNILIQRGSLHLVAQPDSQPMVSCLMVTRGRLFPGRFAVESFVRQTYPNRELVLVCDGPGTEIEAYCGLLKDPRIRVVYPDKAANTLGSLRNLSLQAALGDWICQWDDDDLYHPQRIELGMAVCRSMQANALFLQRWLLWSPHERKIGISGPREWEGSMLAERYCVPPYPALSRGEDTAVAQAMIASLRVVLTDTPWLYTYVQTGVNTWSENHFKAIWSAASHVEPAEYYDAAVQAAASSGLHDAYADAFASTEPVMTPHLG